MAKYLSGKLKNLKVGLDNYSEDKVVLDIVGIVSAKGGFKVGGNLTMDANTGSISATSFIGDGSGLEGIVGQGAGVVIKDDNTLVGTAGTINLGTNLVATPISAGIVTINVTPEIDLVNIGAQTLEVTGIATFKEDLEFISAGSTVAVFDISTGSLGIGSLSPAAKLDVKGTIETDALKVVGIATIGLVTVYGTTGIVSAIKYYGDGINLTGIGDTEYIDSASLQVSGITTFTCNGGTEGDSHTLRLVNSGVTTVGFSTYFLFPSGSAPSIPTADGTVSLISFTVHRQGSAGIATQLLAGASLNFS